PAPVGVRSRATHRWPTEAGRLVLYRDFLPHLHAASVARLSGPPAIPPGAEFHKLDNALGPARDWAGASTSGREQRRAQWHATIARVGERTSWDVATA